MNPFRLDRSQAATADQNHNYTPEQTALDKGLVDLYPSSTGTAGPPPGTLPNTPPYTTTGLNMGYYDGNTVTAMWNYAQHYAMSDNSYDTEFGPSTPGALNLVSGQLNGAINNANGTASVTDGSSGSTTVIGDADPVGDTCSTATGEVFQMTGKNIGDLLNAKGISWGFYTQGFDLSVVNANGTTGCKRSTTSLITTTNKADYIPHHEPFQYYKSTANPTHARPTSALTVGTTDAANHQYDVHDFYDAINAGNFPAVNFLKAPGFQDAHAGYSDPLDEQTFVVTVINFLQQSGYWSDTAVVIAYDDSDGWYDHQMPPIVNQSNSPADVPGFCGTNANALAGVGGIAHANGRCGYGPRLPMMVISPWSKKNYVDHTVTDQTSIIRFVEDNWLEGQRIGSGSFDGIANSIQNMMDFNGKAPAKGTLLLSPTSGEVVTHTGGQVSFCREHRSSDRVISDPFSRRTFLTGTAALALTRAARAIEIDPLALAKLRFKDPLPIPSIAKPVGKKGSAAKEAPLYRLTMREASVRVHRDLPATSLWTFDGASPGPIIETRSGEGLYVEWANRLPSKHFLPNDHSLHGAEKDKPQVRSVVHVHGAKVPPEADGYPEDWYVPGESKTYYYPNQQDAATLWYHDHAMGINRLNIYAGLFGLFIVRDSFEEALNLPNGRYEIPLIICDRSFNRDGSLSYPDSGFPDMPWVPEAPGEAMMVNGKLFPYLEVEPRKYRFRILNAANSRFFHLALTGDLNFTLIGTDQGLIPAPVSLMDFAAAPAERFDVIVDFSAHAGENIILHSDTFDIMQFRVARQTTAPDTSVIPSAIRKVPRTPESSAVKTRTIMLAENKSQNGDSMIMLIGGMHWDMPVTENPVIDTTEIWEIVNTTEDTHPIHLHLVRFQLLDRRNFDEEMFFRTHQVRYTSPAAPPERHEMGWKDTIQAHSNSITRIIVKFEGYTGRYVWHCHVLEHEDNEMMRPYDVLPKGTHEKLDRFPRALRRTGIFRNR